jgi:hypothetical protein
VYAFHVDDDDDLHEQILHIEAHIEELTDIIERCREDRSYFKSRRCCRRNLDLGHCPISGGGPHYGRKSYHPFVKRMQLIDAVARVGLLDGWA